MPSPRSPRTITLLTDFGTADSKRDELAALGWDVRDTPEGPKLVRSG